MVVIRLKRVGTKNRPLYRIIVADKRSPRDGRFIEQIGSYNPHLQGMERVEVDGERASYWLGQGAQPSERVGSFFKNLGLMN